ncbi:MAG: hypothetical protein GY696_37615 [Gammaproteobacteria bacterium]|nr:hypothetical protein [Gammaproteobacteria bacterium]
MVSNDGLHGMQERSGEIGLKEGLHAIRVIFFEKAGGAGLEVSCEGPGISKQHVPDSSLYRVSSGTQSNLALGRPTSQSSTGHGGVSSRAVDGNTSGIWGDESVTHTNPQHGAWWRVELEAASQVSQVILWNRTDCCSDRLANFHVDLLDRNDNVITTRNHSGTANVQTTISISGDDVYAVRVQLNGSNILSLAEVQVFGGSTSSPTGTITRQVWTGISGTTLSLLTDNANYPDNPTITDELTSFEASTDWADNYGTRIAGYLTPETTGTYTFWIASDDNGELWLSTDSSPSNKQRIAYVPGWTASREWDWFSEQRSVEITLTAGQRYYIEALQKEHGGGDNLAVAWQQPGGSQEVISGEYLSPLD